MDQLVEELYRCHYKEILLYLYSLCKRWEQAEDLTQETFLKALLALPKHHPNFRAWLYMVARNLYLNAYQKEKRIVYAENLSMHTVTEADAILGNILRTERNKLLHQALMLLEPRKREVLMLHYFGGLQQKEIAAVMKLTLENVKVLSYRGKRDLKQYMEEHGYDLS